MTTAHALAVAMVAGVIVAAAFLLVYVEAQMDRALTRDELPLRAGGTRVAPADYWPLDRPADPGWTRFAETGTLSDWQGLTPRHSLLATLTTQEEETMFEIGEWVRGFECQSEWNGSRLPRILDDKTLHTGFIIAVYPNLRTVVEVRSPDGTTRVLRRVFRTAPPERTS